MPAATRTFDLPSYVAGEAVQTGDRLDVFYPYTNERTGSAALITPAHLEEAIRRALRGGEPLTRYQSVSSVVLIKKV